MVMKSKILGFLLAFVGSQVMVFGQLNPVNDLYYEQTYWFMNSNCPAYNCFEISWSQPDPSNDTLLGYKVFKGGVFWTYTEETDVTCSGYSPCEYPDFFDDIPFWITIKAVYNNDSLMSIANDSVEVIDIAITIEEFDPKEIVVLKNPISAGENISILIPDTGPNSLVVKIYSLGGQVLKDTEINDHNGGLLHFSSTNLNPGIYIINILTNNRLANRKILIK
jgi:hypothetical protein